MKYLIALLLMLAPCAAADESAQTSAFSQGRYEEIIALAESEPNADNLAFAARSLLAKAMSSADQTPPPSLAQLAEDYARRALSVDAHHVEARLQLAIALSLQARPMSAREAMRAGYGTQARDLVETVLSDTPDNAYAHGYMAVWNIEVVRRGGRFGAAMLGASVRKARAHYTKAIAVDASDASTHWQYARALTALNARKYRRDIDTALDAALVVETESELERTMQARAQQLKTALETQSRKACEQLAKRML